MNPFRSLARAIRNALDFGKKETEVPAPPPARKPYRSAFTRGGGGDGFEAGARGRPVDLSGGVKLKYEVDEEPVAPPPPEQSDFVASLDDLGTLIEAEASALPLPPGAEPLGATALGGNEDLGKSPEAEAALALGGEDQTPDQPQPMDFFEGPPDAPEPMDFFEPAPVAQPPAVAASPNAAEPMTPPAAVEQKVTPAVAPAAPQHTVALLMPIGRERPARAEAAAQFSTLELIDTMAQLLPPELAEPPPVAVEPPPVAVEPPPVAVEPQPVAVEPPPVAVEQSPVVESPPPAEPPALPAPQPAAVEPPPVAEQPPAAEAKSDPAPE